MCRRATVRLVMIAGLAMGSWCAWGQGPGAATGVGWRHIGNSAMELALPSLATGGVDRVWYSPDGASLYAKTASGRVFETRDFEQWQFIADPKIGEQTPSAASIPEAVFQLASGAAAGRLYGAGCLSFR